MSHSISDACLGCGACMPECPCDAIAEGNPYTIDEGKCTDCGACAETCPAGAISA